MLLRYKEIQNVLSMSLLGLYMYAPYTYRALYNNSDKLPLYTVLKIAHLGTCS